MQNYVYDIYFPLRHSKSLYCQLQYVHIVKQGDDSVSIPSSTTNLNKCSVQTLKTNISTEFKDLLKFKECQRNTFYRKSISANVVHNEITKQKRENWSVYNDNISDEQLEARKQRDCEYNNVFRTSIAGTELHETRKQCDRECNKSFTTSIRGTEFHEEIKRQKREILVSLYRQYF